MFFVYAIINREYNKIYIGQTCDIEQRLKLHNQRTFKKSFTAKFSGKWELIYKEEFLTRSEALKREKELKSYRGREFLKQLSGVAQR